MKYLVYIFFWAVTSYSSKAQIVSYAEMLCTANEVLIKDSLNFTACPEDIVQLDTNLVKQVFTPLYHAAGKVWGNKINWGLAGKITNHPQYDLLLLLEKNESNASSWYNMLHLVSMDKSGKYIASFGLYMSRSTHYSSYQTSSCLYLDLRITQHTKIKASHQAFGGKNEYRISEEGMFVYYAKN